MPAHVEERPRPIVAADDENRHVAGPRCEAVADLRDATGMPHVLPGAAKDLLLLAS